MKNKKNTPLVRAELQPFLDSYKDLLIQGLLDKGIISKTKKEGAEVVPSYELSSDAQNNLSNEKLNENDLGQFNKFILVATNVYNNLTFNGNAIPDNVPVSEVIGWLKHNTFFDPELTSLINDNEIVDEQAFRNLAVNLTKSKKIHFNLYIYSLLEYYTFETIPKYFNSLNFFLRERISMISTPSKIVDLLGKNKFDGPDILFEIKYRRNLFSGIKEGLFQAYEILNAYQKENSKSSFMILLMYTDESSTIFEKSKTRFSGLLNELFPEYSQKMLFVPASINELNKVRNEFEFVQDIVFSDGSLNFIEFDFMIDKWLNEWDINGENHGSEQLEIKEDGSYIRNDEHIFNIENFSYNRSKNQISFIKASARPAAVDNRRLLNTLTVSDKYFLVGTEYNLEDTDPKVYGIRYTRMHEATAG